MPETCRVLLQNKFWIFDASSWLFDTKRYTVFCNFLYLQVIGIPKAYTEWLYQVTFAPSCI